MSEESLKVETSNLLIVAISSVVCWLPLIAPYVLFADDFTFERRGLIDFFRDYGTWRFVGLSYLKLLFALGSWAPGVVTISLHTLNSILYYCVSRQAQLPRNIALLGAIGLATCPAAFEAMTWVAASFIIPATTLFLLSLWVSASRFFAAQVWLQVLLLSVLSLLANLFQENLFFAFLLVPFWPLVLWRGLESRLSPQKFVNVPALMGVALGLFLYVLAHRLFPGLTPFKVIAWHPRALLSSVGYQATGIFAFEPAFRLFAYSYLTVLPWNLLIPVALSLGLLFGISRSRLSNGDESNVQPGSYRNVIVGWIVGLFLTGSIFSLAGGMSLDARKTYPFLPSLIGACAIPLFIWLKVGSWRKANVQLVAIFIVMLCATTSWLIIGFWRTEALRGQRLADYILSYRISGPVRLINTDWRKSAFKYFTCKLGNSVDDEAVINASLRGKSRIQLSNSSDAVRLVYSDGSWRIASN